MCEILNIEDVVLGRFLKGVASSSEAYDEVSYAIREDLVECLEVAQDALNLLVGLGIRCESLRAIRHNLEAAKDRALPLEERHDIVMSALEQLNEQLVGAANKKGEDGNTTVCPLELARALVGVFNTCEGRPQ